jgi:hypothetical protein
VDEKLENIEEHFDVEVKPESWVSQERTRRCSLLLNCTNTESLFPAQVLLSRKSFLYTTAAILIFYNCRLRFLRATTY